MGMNKADLGPMTTTGLLAFKTCSHAVWRSASVWREWVTITLSRCSVKADTSWVVRAISGISIMEDFPSAAARRDASM